MSSSRILQVSICTGDAEKSLSFFRDFVGLSVTDDRSVDCDEAKKLWGLQNVTAVRSVTLKSPLQSSLVELLEFAPAADLTIRKYARNWDYGLFNLGFVVNDIDSVFRRLAAMGYRSLSDPVTYAPLGNKVREVIAIVEDDVPIVHLDRLKGTDSCGRAGYLRLNHSLIIVDEVSQVTSFYHDVFGLDITRNAVLPEGAVDTVLALPGGTASKIAFVGDRDRESLVLVFMELSVKGRTLAPIAHPPNRGLFMLTLETNNLVDTLARAQSKGIRAQTGPFFISSRRHGRVLLAHLRCPGGVLIEIIERVEDRHTNQ
jgi:catechol 2,3-dioxygenase-like lactoylglutathione lyase family enzyme